MEAVQPLPQGSDNLESVEDTGSLSISWRTKKGDEEVHVIRVRHTDTLESVKQTLETKLNIDDLSDHFLLVGEANVVFFDDGRTVGTLSLVSNTHILMLPKQSTVHVRVSEDTEPLTFGGLFETTVKEVKEQV
jgi:hypothetical protein